MANSEEKLRESEQKLLCCWSPPKVSVHNVYERRGLFELRPRCKINKVTKTASIQGEYQELQLLKKQDIWDHMQKYNNLHVGLVQVAIKPLTSKGLNCSVLVCLRDCRMAKFGDSLLAVAQSSLSDGPIYFDYYPNYPVSLAVSNTNILDTLTLNIRTQGLMNDVDEGPRPGDVAVVYRVYYKVMVGDRAKPKKQSPKGQTHFVETNLLRNDKLPVLVTARWNSIRYPERWVTGASTGGED